MYNGYFSSLNDKQKIFVCTIPQHVSVTKNPDEETNQQIIERQDRFLNLPSKVINKLSSIETSEKIQEIGNLFKLNLLQLADISRTIRSYYFSEIKLEDFPSVLAREIPTDVFTAKKISDQIIKKIINDETLGINKNLIDTSIFQALQQYPQIGEQLITSSPIKIKIFPTPVRPSVKNWIEDYRSVMGAQKHGMMERGNYLFHSENTKRLTAGERKKLAEVLRSLDEDVTLKIDPDRQEIIFQQDEQTASNKQVEKISNFQFPISSEIPNPKSQIPGSYQNSNKNVVDLSQAVRQKNNDFDKSKTERMPQQSATPTLPKKIEVPQARSANVFSRMKSHYQPFTPSLNYQGDKKIPKISSREPEEVLNNKPYSYIPSAQKNFTSESYGSTPKQQSNAGLSWDEMVKRRQEKVASGSEPKIDGNVVDLKN